MAGSWRGKAVIASVVLSAVGYLGFSLWGGGHDVAAAIARVGVPGVLLMLALSLICYALRFVRWQMYLAELGHRVPPWPSAMIYISGFALTTTPGKAGETIRSLLLKPYGVSYADSLAAFLSERLSDLVAVVLLACIGLAMYPAAAPLVAAGAGATLALMALISHPTWLRRGAERTAQATSRSGRLLHKVCVMLESAARCQRPRPLLVATVLSVLAWGSEAVALWLLLGWLGIDSGWMFAFFVYALSMLAGALSFLPGGLGGAEATMVGLLLWAGHSQPEAVAATVLIRLTTLWFAVLIGGAMLLAWGRRAAVEPATAP